MSPERWAQIKEILDAVLELPQDERVARIAVLCGEDASLKKEVESLLEAHQEASSFLETPVGLAPPIPEDERLAAGLVIGKYRIVQHIGEGGMGAVYQALREDIRKLVALKVLKRSLHMEFVIRRFENERQILAHFDHPYITKFLDSGLTADGRPYFVMEFVPGEQIDEFCDRRCLNTLDRLKLFLKVCEGVEYAHRNLVVHRDIKPRNILITESGDPKLLDFGIAKVIEEDPVTGAQSATVTVVRVMTPEYASPEQASGAPITTASDVYSLGVLLYELLTGHAPYRLKGRMPHEAAQVICQEEPAPPSAVVRRIEPSDLETGAAEVTPESVSATREAHPVKLQRALAGDLDNILLKALEKEPARRYRSVEQLADDIRRHLDGLPVLARGASVQYRAWKFFRRHKAAVTAAMLVAVSLVAGILATTRQAQIANQQRALAERRFRDVRALANSLMFDVHDAIQDLPGATAAREMLVKRALQYLDGLASESAGDTGLRRDLAAAYEKVGDVLGGTRSANLGDLPGAVNSYRKAATLRESALGVPPEEAQQRDLVRNYGKLSEVLARSGDGPKALEQSQNVLNLARTLASQHPENTEDQRNLASAYVDLGTRQAGSDDWKTGLDNLKKGIAVFEKLAADNPKDNGIRRRLAVSYERAGLLLGNSEALAMHRKELAVAQQISAAEPLNVVFRRLAAVARMHMGDDLMALNDSAGALPHFQQSLGELELMAAEDPKNTQLRFDIANESLQVADAHTRLGDTNKAESLLKKVLAMLEGLPAGNTRVNLSAKAEFLVGRNFQRIADDPELSQWRRNRRLTDARGWYQRCLDRLSAAAGSDRRLSAEATAAVQKIDAELAAHPAKKE